MGRPGGKTWSSNVEPCGSNELLEAVKGTGAKIARKFAGTHIADCDHEGKTYSCTSRTLEERCKACVLCRKKDGKVFRFEEDPDAAGEERCEWKGK